MAFLLVSCASPRCQSFCPRGFQKDRCSSICQYISTNPSLLLFTCCTPKVPDPLSMCHDCLCRRLASACRQPALIDIDYRTARQAGWDAFHRTGLSAVYTLSQSAATTHLTALLALIQSIYCPVVISGAQARLTVAIITRKQSKLSHRPHRAKHHPVKVLGSISMLLEAAFKRSTCSSAPLPRLRRTAQRHRARPALPP